MLQWGLGFLPEEMLKSVVPKGYDLKLQWGLGFLPEEMKNASGVVLLWKNRLQWGLGFLPEEMKCEPSATISAKWLQWGLGFLPEEMHLERVPKTMSI